MIGRMQLGIYGTHGTGQFDFYAAKYIVIPEGLFDFACLVQTGGV